MSIESSRAKSVRPTSQHDPRDTLARDKYFSQRPTPLERWLWDQGVPAAAERVFWLHWQAGLRGGDWTSQIPLRQVAADCRLDISTVTRAYQLLAKLGVVRRTDPGRDCHNPFQQATAVTEVRVPQALCVELNRHPNRPRPTPVVAPSVAPEPAPVPEAADALPPTSPFTGLRARDMIAALHALTLEMSAAEKAAWNEAQRTHRGRMEFDEGTRVGAEKRAHILQFLQSIADRPAHWSAPAPISAPHSGPRRLSVFELARLQREVQKISGMEAAREIVRQIVWAVEEGSLCKFTPTHSVNIALKKLRDGAWTRPNRMPPNWVRALSTRASLETCASA